MSKFSEFQQLKLGLWIGVLALVGLSAGCASFGRTMKSLVSSDEPVRSAGPRFSEQDQIPVETSRKYRRMTRDRFEEDSELGSQAGSLWVMEGQGAYLFSQNKMRMQGDLLNIRLEGNPRSQLQSKVKTITKLLERLDSPVRGLASADTIATKPTTAGTGTTPGSAAQGAGAGDPSAQPGSAGDMAATGAGPSGAAGGASSQPAGATAGTGAGDKTDPLAAIQTIPTRIVEQLKDGSYRVRGLQPFMIGRREYRVIVTGVVRQEDFDEQGIDASKLLDPQFDIVSARKGATL